MRAQAATTNRGTSPYSSTVTPISTHIAGAYTRALPTRRGTALGSPIDTP